MTSKQYSFDIKVTDKDGNTLQENWEQMKLSISIELKYKNGFFKIGTFKDLIFSATGDYPTFTISSDILMKALDKNLTIYSVVQNDNNIIFSDKLSENDNNFNISVDSETRVELKQQFKRLIDLVETNFGDRGKFIAGYKITEKIGEGDFGIIYKAVGKGETVAIKKIPKNNENYYPENAILKKMGDSCNQFFICYILFTDINPDDNYVYLVMEYLEGYVTLSTKMQLLFKEKNRLKEQICIIISNICEGIKLLHTYGIAHNDLTPNNIMIDKYSNIKIVDFGTSCLNECNVITYSKQLDYVDPLVYKKFKDYVGKAIIGQFFSKNNLTIAQQGDLWSLGIIIYEIIIGSTPKRNYPNNDAYFNTYKYENESHHVKDEIKKFLNSLPNSLINLDNLLSSTTTRKYLCSCVEQRKYIDEKQLQRSQRLDESSLGKSLRSNELKKSLRSNEAKEIDDQIIKEEIIKNNDEIDKIKDIKQDLEESITLEELKTNSDSNEIENLKKRIKELEEIERSLKEKNKELQSEELESEEFFSDNFYDATASTTGSSSSTTGSSSNPGWFGGLFK